MQSSENKWLVRLMAAGCVCFIVTCATHCATQFMLVSAIVA